MAVLDEREACVCVCVCVCVRVCGIIGVDEARHVWRCGAGRVRRLGGDGREGGTTE